MKKRNIIYSLVLLSIQLGFSQYTLKNVEDVNWYSNIAQEKIFVHQNATLLFSGEQLSYKVYCLNAKTNTYTNNSKIAYVELIGKDGLVFKHKLRLENGTGQSNFYIPSSVKTGHYKLIAYTQWMKNGEEGNYFQSDLGIINPYTKISFDENGDSGLANETKLTNRYQQIDLKTDSDTYNKREEVNLTIKSLNAANAYGNYSLSVRRVDELPNQFSIMSSNSINDRYNQSIGTKKAVGESIYLPEFKGEMIRGKVVNPNTGKLTKKIEVSLSILSDEAYQDIILTNDQGIFYFHLADAYSQSKAMIQVLGDDRANYKIEIDNHESIRLSNLEFNELQINSNFEKQIIERSVQNQIQNAYLEIKQDRLITPFYKEPFFGNHMVTYQLDDYKRFPTVAETLIEVVENAWHERGKGKQRFINVRERQNDPYYEVDILPMLVVDGALIQDHDIVMDLDASLVESISVLRDEYYYGNRVYQGVLMVNTIEGNYYNNLSESYIKLIDLFSPQLAVAHFKQDYNIESDSERIPDYRNQLLWFPYFQFQAPSRTIQFFTSDVKGKYLISLEGFTISGVPISIKKLITVN